MHISVDADLEEVRKPASAQLLHRAARELLVNVDKHAAASRVQARWRATATGSR